MKKAIVTTTINPPTIAFNKFLEIAARDDWHIFVVGDNKTPHAIYLAHEAVNERVHYLMPEMQEDISKELSDLIGWNCIQRRNFGLIAAYKWGAEILATVDDDNIPADNWGQNLAVGKKAQVQIYAYKDDVPATQTLFDPLAPTSQGPNMWHRGFPLQLLKHRTRLAEPTTEFRNVLIQADLWNGDPDIDAILRISTGPNVKFKVMGLYAGELPGPFNSQNTFLHRSVIPDYFLYPHIGRMDDIWAAYYVQRKHPNSVVYGPASVRQDRNEHDLVKDMDAEQIGYHHSLDFANWCYGIEGVKVPEFFPEKALEAFKVYQSVLKEETK